MAGCRDVEVTTQPRSQPRCSHRLASAYAAGGQRSNPGAWPGRIDLADHAPDPPDRPQCEGRVEASLHPVREDLEARCAQRVGVWSVARADAHFVSPCPLGVHGGNQEPPQRLGGSRQVHDPHGVGLVPSQGFRPAK